MAQVSIIIPAWNLWETTLQCLESIVANIDSELLQQAEVLVVDNGSSDETTKALSPTLMRLFGAQGRAIVLPENQGFAKACNIGAKNASAPLLFFLNNDTLLTKNCLSPLIEALHRNAKLGIVGPLLLYPGDKIQHAGICLNPFLELTHSYHLLPKSYAPAHKSRTWQAITGAAMLIPATLFAQCNGFHEEYINGFEDLDLCCQVRNKGLQLTVVGKSIVYHITSQTPGRFTHDESNTALLKQRCAEHFSPDEHLIALEDGLVPILSPDLAFYAKVTEAKESALTHIFKTNFDLQRCKNQIEAEPYWLGGYAILAEYYENHGDWHCALDYRLQAARLIPIQESFIAMAKCAAKANEYEIMLNAQQCLQDTINKLKDQRSLKQKAIAIRNIAMHKGDLALKEIFDQWLTTYST